MKYKYVIEEINKRNKPLKWFAMLSSMFGLYFTIVVTGITLIIIYNIVIVLIVLGIIGLLGLSIMIFAFIRMFPRIEKMPYYKTGGFLREHINTTTFAIMLLFFVFSIIAPLLINVFLPFLNILSFSYLIVYFPLDMGFFALLLFYIVPFGLKLPNGRGTFKQFSSSIGLNKFKPLWKNALIGIAATVILLLSSLLIGIWLGIYTFNPNVLFGPPVNIFNLGWFSFFFMLKPGIWEEVAFRGVILNLQVKKYKLWTAVLINGIIFGLFHFTNLLDIPTPDPLGVSLQVFFAACLGIALSYMYIKTNSLLPCILTHFLVDVFIILFVPYDFPNLINEILFGIFGRGIVPAILIVLLVFLIFRNKNSRL